jgi:hypothetical protein
MAGGKVMDQETLERFVVQLLGIAQRCTDVPSQRDLMRLANEVADLIEGREPSEKTGQSH